MQQQRENGTAAASSASLAPPRASPGAAAVAAAGADLSGSSLAAATAGGGGGGGAGAGAPDGSGTAAAASFEAFAQPKTLQQAGDVPPPRFGHTTTNVGSNRVVLFGGAVGAAGAYSITNESYVYDSVTNRWSHLFAENPPPPRAAHAACCVDALQLVVFGGATGGGSLSAEELYLLDLRKEPQLQWMPVPLQGTTPGRRYGHSMVYNKPNIIVFGGNDGERPLADVWFMDVEKSPFRWEEVVLDAQAKRPLARVYHATEVCREGPASGMVVVFGGRSSNNKSLNDTWGLRQHRDGRWDWIAAPTKKQQLPDPRFQHTMVFIGSKMVTIGGRTDNDCTRPLQTAVYDTETVEWRVLASVGRFRHSSWVVRNTVFTFGGFTHQTQQHPTADLLLLDCTQIPSFYSEREREDIRRKKLLQQEQHMAVTAAAAAASAPAAGPAAGAPALPPPPAAQAQQPGAVAAAPAPLQQPQQQTAAAAAAVVAAAGRAHAPLGVAGVATGKTATLLQQQQLQSVPQALLPQQPLPPSTQGGPQTPFLRQTTWTATTRSTTRPAADIKLASHVNVVHECGEDFSSLVRRISIDRLEEEGKKINKDAFRPAAPASTAGETRRDMLVEKILKLLLRPLVTQQQIFTTFNTDAPFVLPWTDVSYLCDIVLEVVKEDDMVLHLRAPIKVYGDIHGQYHDLMRLFHLYKMPVEEEQSAEYAGAGGAGGAAAPLLLTSGASNSSLGGGGAGGSAAAAAGGGAGGGGAAATPAVIGDIDTNDYLFLGDYVDRGLNSLETICLLFALKVKYPRQVHLLRGNHEDPAINSLYGFQDECKRRLREDPFDINSCWQRFNRVFEYLPVAAVIDDGILCLHGGIGGTISSVADLAALQRPLKVAQVPQNVYEQRVTDLLWSDPTDNDSILGVVRNDVRDPDGSGHIYKFGPDRVHAFLAENNLQLIIRAHECVMDGFERFAGGKLITLFSATNYCNHHQNAGALLFIRRDLTIIPKLIYPANSPLQYNSWDARMAELRPPTPPRAAPRMREKEFVVEEGP